MFDYSVSIAEKWPPANHSHHARFMGVRGFLPSFVCTSQKIQNVPVDFSSTFLVTCAVSVFFPETSERMCFSCRTDLVLAQWCQISSWNRCPRLRKLKVGRARRVGGRCQEPQVWCLWFSNRCHRSRKAGHHDHLDVAFSFWNGWRKKHSKSQSAEASSGQTVAEAKGCSRSI